MGKRAAVALVVAMLSIAAAVWAADETSSGDKLRILYSNRFTFTDGGVPLVTVEIMGGQNRIILSANGGLVALPDGEGGATVTAGASWDITVENGAPAKTREWTVVATFSAGEDEAVSRALARWRALGYEPRAFETGTVFGVDGEVIDSREVSIAIEPQPAGRGARTARAIARKHGFSTSVHRELVARPSGTVIARSGSVEIRNPSVVWFAPRKQRATVRVADVVIGGGGSQLGTSRETRRYFGAVYVAVGRDGKLVAVNAIAADQLLAGLVPSETFTSAPRAALEAQAVAARTELLEKKIGTRHFGDPFLLCSNQHCQVYSGAGKEHPRTTKAVGSTRGLVLMGADGELVDARYSASCGGHGEHNDSVWGGEPDPHLRGRADAPARSALGQTFDAGITDANIDAFLATNGAHCAASRFSEGRYRWKREVGVAALSARVAEKYPEVGMLSKVIPLQRGVSGRILRLELRGARGRAIAEGELHIRRLFGGLRSSLFVVERRGDAFVFDGAGFGHGVGMCQTGAIGMAEKRNSFRDILYHYYRGSQIRRLY